MRHSHIYKIRVINFNKYNSGLKKGHKSTLISNNFCTDPKLGVVPLSVRWMFLGIVLTCGDHTRDSVELSESQLRAMLESSWSVTRALDSLQSLQVLTYDKIDLLLNRIEKNRIEKNRIEKNISTEPKKSVPVVATTEINLLTKQVSIKNDLIKSWSDTYPKEYLEMELKKARSWLISNSHKAPKSNFGRFFNSWFDRGWENYRKTLSSNGTQITVEDLEEILKGET